MPWRDDATPYHVWLSEIMLQQTRIEAAKAYYDRFTRCLPDIPSLAAVSEEELLKLWEGLGYYNRARNLKKAASLLVERYDGRLPADYDLLLSLPGIGRYTAGAIASIAYGLAEPAVDGNVLRVTMRYLNCDEDIMKMSVRTKMEKQLRAIMPKDCPGEFNQALMELGACVCVPNGAPKCGACPLRTVCLAEKSGAWASLPVKEAKKPRRIEEKTVFFLQCGGQYAVRKRPETGLLAGLWELPNVEGTLDAQQALALLDSWGLVPEELTRTRERTHIFTHVEWRMRCYDIRVSMPADSLTWVSGTRFQQDIALPTAFRIFWQPEDAE